LDAGSFDSISSAMQNLSMPLPEEPVGRWEVRQAMSSGGLQSFTKTAFEITALDGRTMTLKSTIDQTAPSQAVTNPAPPPGADMHLQKMTGTGNGTITLHVDGLVPTSDTTMQNNTMMPIRMGGYTQTTTALTMKVGISPLK
jgi:hypothetical protein